VTAVRRLERILLGPGPSCVPPEVLAALSRPLVGHLDPEFLELLDETAERLRAVFRTANRLTFAVSGTGSAGMEAALVNILEPGDTAIVCVNGVFGQRMCDVAARAGADVVRVEAAWGEAVPSDRVTDALRSRPGAKVLACVHAETSTGVAQPMEEIASSVRDHGALFVLDAVTSLAGMPVEVDEWGVDVCYAGTQKCLSVPPGLAPITFSERAVEAVRSRSTEVRSWYFDVTMLERYWGEDRVYHHTAPVAMLRGLHAGLGLVLEEGLEARWERHARLGDRLAKELEGRGFSYVPEAGFRLPMLHCVRLPAMIENEAAVRSTMLDEHGIEVGGGLGEFRGRAWRIGLMGHSCRARNIAALLAALDEVVRT
jgi:alanine-glyoxylate transaminase/serine-glyoxylate transaminase/serine-pyruvate transaminase